MSVWEEHYRKNQASFEEAAGRIQSGDFVGIALGVGACTPPMYEAILNRHEELTGVMIADAVQLRPNRLYDPGFMGNLLGRIDYCPAFGISTIRKIHSTLIPDFLPITAQDFGDKMAANSDVYIVMITPPNSKGYVNLGLTNFYTMETVRKGKASGKLRLAIAEVNENMPIVLGDNWMHVSEFDCFIEHNSPIPIFSRSQPTEMEKTIAGYVLDLINDGDTIQMGIGGISEAVVCGLEGKHDLGITTEMFPIGLHKLVEQGIVTNARKPRHRGVTLATICMGDQELYDYISENPSCEFYPSSYTNNPVELAQYPNLVAINMAVMMDLSGQISSEGWGHRMISGGGGQLDFMLGSYWSEGGKGVTLLSSARQQADGSLSSSILPELPPGTPVTVPRTYAQYVVTEYGVADLRNKSRRQRALALIEIAHPDLRGELRKSLQKNFYPGFSAAISNITQS